MDKIRNWAREQLEKLEFARDEEGQTLLEYIILASLVLLVAGAAYLLFQTIRQRFLDVNTELEGIPYQ